MCTLAMHRRNVYLMLDVPIVSVSHGELSVFRDVGQMALCAIILLQLHRTQSGLTTDAAPCDPGLAPGRDGTGTGR